MDTTKSYLTREELLEIGVNPDNMNYPDGEMNIIVQMFGYENGTVENDETGELEPVSEVYPDVYHPRKNEVYCTAVRGDGIYIADEDEKKDFVKHLRDSAERLKIMAHYLSCQANEIEEFGYPKTTCYYPE